jgi:hypothetical protein
MCKRELNTIEQREREREEFFVYAFKVENKKV